MLPQAILAELFDMRRTVSDIITQQIGDELETFCLTILDVTNYDHAIVLHFQSQDKVTQGELRVNRVRRQFELHAKVGQYMMFPVFGPWEEIIAALAALVEPVPSRG
jgi:hypothetical protein